MKIFEFINKIPKKHLYGLLIIFGISLILLILYFTKDGKITKSDIDGYKTYTSRKLACSFDFPKDYKIKKKKDSLYIQTKKDFYIKIDIVDIDKNAKDYLEETIKKSKEEYGNAFTPITEAIVSRIGDKYTIKKTFHNYVEGKLNIEERYVYEFNNKIVVVSSISLNETNENLTEIINNIISSMK